jgi:2-polyprenyl-6-methoxyphenol hydroxylase-like FAD-dependent oxidoreductase
MEPIPYRVVSCRQRSYGNVVLICDAAHTAHFSIGSGTKMAMEDAIALVDALARQQNLDQSLQAYAAARRPAVEALQRAAAKPGPVGLLSTTARPARTDLAGLVHDADGPRRP